MECAICYDAPGLSCIASCEHLFCFRCIRTWCVEHEAVCPICRTPVQGLIDPCGRGGHYLHPHDGKFGFSLTRTRRLGLVVTRVAPSSAAEAAGLETGARVASINGVCTYVECVTELLKAAREGRIAHVETCAAPSQKCSPFAGVVAWVKMLVHK